MSMNGDYRSLAEAAGERIHQTAWTPGVDFDPSDPDEMAVMELVWENERYDRMAQLERENADLRARIAELTGEE